MKCPKCGNELVYQYMLTCSMYRCSECAWLGNIWQIIEHEKENKQCQETFTTKMVI